MFSGDRISNLRAHHSSGKRGLPSFPLNDGPEGWESSGMIDAFSHIPILHLGTVGYGTVYYFSVGDVTEVDEVDVYNQRRTLYKST